MRGSRAFPFLQRAPSLDGDGDEPPRAAKFNPPTLAVVWNLVDAMTLLTELAVGGEMTRDHVEALDRAPLSLGDAAKRSGLPDVAERYCDARGQLRQRFGAA